MNSVSQNYGPRIPLRKALIAWTPETEMILVTWVDRTPGLEYTHTSGAAYAYVRDLKGIGARCYLLDEFFSITVEHRVPAHVVDRAFYRIKEWVDLRERISAREIG